MKAGWEEVALGEVTQSINGLWKGKKPPFRKARVLRNTNFRSHGKLSLDDVAEIEVQVSQFAKRKLQKGDIILERSGGGPKQPVGRVAYFNEDGDDFSFSNFTSVIRVSDQRLDPRYLLQVLNGWHYLGETEKLQKRSTGIRNLRFAEYKAKTIPLPPLEEQKRIVAVLDTAFAKLDRARANVEANLADAEALFRASVEHHVRNGDTTTRPLHEIVYRLTNGYVGPIKGVYQDEGIPYLLARHVKDNVLTFDGKTFVSAEFNQKHKKSILEQDDVLLVQSGHIGHCAVVGADHEGHNCHAMIVITTRKDILSGSYLAALFASRHFKEEFRRIRTGSTVPHLTCKLVKLLEIPLLSLDRQQRIVHLFEQMQAHKQAFAKSYSDAKADTDALRQSLLQRAFAGELT